MNESELDRLAKTEPKMRDEPQAFKRACIRMGYEAACGGGHVLAMVNLAGEVRSYSRADGECPWDLAEWLEDVQHGLTVRIVPLSLILDQQSERISAERAPTPPKPSADASDGGNHGGEQTQPGAMDQAQPEGGDV